MTAALPVLTAGVDEAGRGPLAGPVVVAAVILDKDFCLDGMDDSKRLSETRRERLFPRICHAALAWSVVEVSAGDIDRMNILAATLWGMQKAVQALKLPPDRILIDGNRAPELAGEVETIVQGDRLVPSISAASIIAKVTRDRIMRHWHEQFPDYGFHRHKGYPTAAHLSQLVKLGPCAIHRRSFAPVRRLLSTRCENPAVQGDQPGSHEHS